MAFVEGGPGGGGGGLHFRDPEDEFSAATQTLAEAARSTYFTTTSATAFEEFVTDRSLSIIIKVTGADDQFQTYTGDSGTYDDTAWQDRSDAIRGGKGNPGDDGDQAVWYARIFRNLATAPSVSPTGGSIADDGTITVPTSWHTLDTITAPTTGQVVYESNAVVNPANDTFPLTPTWSFPFEAGGVGGANAAEAAAASATAAAASADDSSDSADEAAASAATANSGADIAVGSPRGNLWATSPTMATASTSSAVDFGTDTWTLESGAPSGVALNNTIEEYLHFPDLHPPGTNGFFVVVKVAGVEAGEILVPWGGFGGHTSSAGFGMKEMGASGRSIRARFYWRNGATAPYLVMYGAGEALLANTVIEIYAAVVRGESGSGGGGGGSVSSDATLTGTGTNADPLEVANPFEAADETKLDAIEAGATADQTGAEIKTAYEAESDTNAFTDADHTKLDGVEAGAAADQSAAEVVVDASSFSGNLSASDDDVQSALDTIDDLALGGGGGGGGLDSVASDATLTGDGTASDPLEVANPFTDADETKLDAIEAGATADQTGDEIKTAYEAESDTNAFTDADHAKLDDIEAGATADQSGAEIKAAYEAESDTNAFTDADDTKLFNIEAGATEDQTGAEIKALYEVEPDTNAFTDDDHNKLVGVEAGATADQSAAEVVVDASSFAGNLSGSDDDLQSALDTIDDLALGSGGQTLAQVNSLIQTALEEAVTANTETGIAVTYNADGTLDFVVAATPAPSHTSYCGVSDDDTIIQTEVDDANTGTGNALAIPAYTGAKHVFFLRPATEGAITAVFVYEDGVPNMQSQLGSWTAFTFTPTGGAAHNGIYSTAALTGAGGFIVEVV